MELREREMSVPKSMINYFAITVFTLVCYKKVDFTTGQQAKWQIQKEANLEKKAKIV